MNQFISDDGSATLGELDHYLFGEGRHFHLHRVLGAHPARSKGLSGVRFAVWAPSAKRVSVVGDFNGWDGRRNSMKANASGIWELFIPGLAPGDLYKYEVETRDGTLAPLKAD